MGPVLQRTILSTQTANPLNACQQQLNAFDSPEFKSSVSSGCGGDFERGERSRWCQTVRSAGLRISRAAADLLGFSPTTTSAAASEMLR